MEVIFLGTGTGVPSAKRAAPALLVEAGTFCYLVDSGAGTLRQLARAGYSYNDLDYIFFTHFHPDHITELIPYLFATKYFPEFTRLEPVRIIGPVGLLELYGHLKEAFGKWVEPPENRVIMKEVGAGAVLTCGPMTVKAVPIPHTGHSLGYRFEEDGGPVLAVSGDTDYGPGLIELARDADLLVTECARPEGDKKEGHLTPSLAGRAAREAGAKALALTHFYPETEGQNLAAGVRREYQGPLLLADDLMRVRLG